MKRAPWVVLAIAIAVGVALWLSHGGEPGPAPSASPSATALERYRSLQQTARTPEADAGDSFELRGEVRDSKGRPVAGATVQLVRSAANSLETLECPVCREPLLDCEDPEALRQVIELLESGEASPVVLATQTTDRDGHFEFPSARGAGLWLVATDGVESGELGGDGAAGAVINLEPHRLSVSVSEGRELPIGGARVVVARVAPLRVTTFTTGPDGRVEIEGAGPGAKTWIFAEAAGHVPTASNGVCQGDQVLILEPLRALIVHPLRDGKPTDAHVTVERRGHRHEADTQSAEARFAGFSFEGAVVTASAGGLVGQATAHSGKRRLGVRVRDAGGDPEDLTLAIELKPAVRLTLELVGLAGDLKVGIAANSDDASFEAMGVPDGGKVTLGPGPAGMYAISVYSQHHRPWEGRLDARAGDASLRVHLDPLVQLSGQVLDHGGQPVRGAALDFTPLVAGIPPDSLLSNDDGTFSIELLHDGAYQIAASHPELGSAHLTANAPATGLLLRLEERGRLKVTARRSRSPVSEGVLLVLEERNHRLHGVSTTTDQDGVAWFAGLPQSEVRITSGTSLLRGTTGWIAITEGGLAETTIELGSGVLVGGSVTSASGSAIEDARVWTEPTEYEARSNWKGEFLFDAVDPLSRFEVHASHPGFVLEAPARFEGGKQPLKLVLRPQQTVRGQALDEQGRPITALFLPSGPRQARDGRFEEPVEVESGNVSTWVGANGFERFKYLGPWKPDLGEIRLQPAATVHGIVRDRRGDPVHGATVDCECAPELAVTEADGSFELTIERPEQSVLLAYLGDDATQLTLGARREVEIALHPSTVVGGRVRDAAGHPIETMVQLSDPHARSLTRELTTTPDGSFTVLLHEGAWEVRGEGILQTVQVSGERMELQLVERPRR